MKLGNPVRDKTQKAYYGYPWQSIPNGVNRILPPHQNFWCGGLLFICILSFSCGFAFAAESSIKIKATVDKNEVAQDEYINYRVVISSTISLDNPKIKLPDLNKEFFILSSSKAQNMSLLAGKTLVEIVLDYVLQPKKSGDIKIEEVEVSFGGKIYKSEPQTIKVKESKELLPKREIPFEGQTEGSEGKVTL